MVGAHWLVEESTRRPPLQRTEGRVEHEHFLVICKVVHWENVPVGFPSMQGCRVGRGGFHSSRQNQLGEALVQRAAYRMTDGVGRGKVLLHQVSLILASHDIF